MNPEHKKYILENIGKKSVKQIAGDLRLKEKAIRRFLEKEERTTWHEKAEAPNTPAVIGSVIAKKMPIFIFILLIIAAGIAAYGNSFSNQFVWDDMLLIKNNTHIESFSALKYIFREDLFHMTHTATGYYRPIQILSYMIDYFFWGRDPLGYHITSFIIQVLNSIIVFYICLLIIRERQKSFFIAAIFCAHPAFVPIVAYISGRADLLGMFFASLSIFLIIKYLIQKKNKIALWLGAILYPLAVISKEYYIIAPLFLLLYLFVFKDESKIDGMTRTALLFMLATVVIYVLLRLTALNFHQKMGIISTKPFLTRAMFFPYILTFHVFTLTFPLNLGMEKMLFYSSLTEPRFISSYITPLLIAIIFLSLYKNKQKDNIFFLGWFIVGIVPVSNLFTPLKALYADHWSYMASIGFFACLISAVDGAAKRLGAPSLYKTARLIFPAAAVIFFIFLSFIQNRFWKNEEVFYQTLVDKGTTGSRPKFNLGRLYEEKSDYKKAFELYDSAIKEFNEDALYFYSRGLLYRKTGNVAKAKDDLEAAVKLEPLNTLYHNDLGAIYAELGISDKARAEWEEALKLDPDNELARKNLNLIRHEPRT